MAVVTGTAAAAGAKAVGAGAKAAAGGAKAAEAAGGAAKGAGALSNGAKAADAGVKAGRAGNASQPATVGRGGKGDGAGNNSKPGADNSKDSGKKPDSDKKEDKKDKKNKDGDKKDSKSQDSKESKDSKSKDSKGDGDKEEGGGLKKNIEKAKKALQNKGKGEVKNKAKEAMNSMTDMDDDVGTSNNGSLANDLRRERKSDEAQQAKIKGNVKKALGKFNPLGGGGGGGIGGAGNMLMAGMKAAFGAVLKVGAMAVAAVTAVITALATILSVAFIIAAIIFAAIVVAIIVIIVILISIFSSFGGQGKDCSNEVNTAETVVASMNSTASPTEGATVEGLGISEEFIVAEVGKIYAYLSACGFSDNQIIGFCANAYGESGIKWYTPEGQYSMTEEEAKQFVLNSYKSWGNGYRHAVGLVQYDGGRRTQFLEWAIANHNGDWTNYVHQLDYIFFVEPSLYPDSMDRPVNVVTSDPSTQSMMGRKFSQMPFTWKEQTKDLNATECMLAWCWGWERPGVGVAEMDKRNRLVKYCEKSDVLQKIRDEAKKYSSEVDTFMQTHQSSSLTDRADQAQLSGGTIGLNNAKKDNICGDEVGKVANGLYGDKLFDQFVEEVVGKVAYNPDGKWGAQCVEGWYYFCNEFMKFNTRIFGVGSAFNLAYSSTYGGRGYEAHFDIYSKYNGDDLSKLTIQDGDWLIWDGGDDGHVGMYYKGQICGQNQDGTLGAPFSLKPSNPAEKGGWLGREPIAVFRLKPQYLLGSSATITPGQKYNLSDTELKHIANLCAREQGSPAGAAAEASLMANLFEQGVTSRSGSTLYEATGKDAWFSSNNPNTGQPERINGYNRWYYHGNASSDIIAAVKDVLVNGNRTMPLDVTEHDCFSDIFGYNSKTGLTGYIVTNNVRYTLPGDIKNRDNYIPYNTMIYNNFGSKYLFVCFPANNSDPFGIKQGEWG